MPVVYLSRPPGAHTQPSVVGPLLEVGRHLMSLGCSPRAVCPFGLERASLLGSRFPVSCKGPSRAGAQGSVCFPAQRGAPLLLGTFQCLRWLTAPGFWCLARGWKRRAAESWTVGAEAGAPTQSPSVALSQLPPKLTWVSCDFAATDPVFPVGGSAFCLE